MLRAAQSAKRFACCAWAWTPSRPAFRMRCAGDAGRIFDFCARIVDATADLAIAFKPQIAYFAAHRAEDQLERLIAHIRRSRAARAGDPGRQARRHRLHRRAVRARSVRALLAPTRSRCRRSWASIRSSRTCSTKARARSCCAARPTPAATTCRTSGCASQPGQPLLVRARGAAGAGPVEHERPARPGGRRDLSGRDRARAGAGADAAAADPRRRRAGRRCGRHRASRLAPRCADRGELVARDPLCVGAATTSRTRPRAKPSAPGPNCKRRDRPDGWRRTLHGCAR